MEQLRHIQKNEVSHKCHHCDEAVITLFKNEEDDLNFFCCSGCRTVYNILQFKGLNEYYDLKEQGPVFRPRGPIAENKENFRYMDSPEFVEEFIEIHKDGTKGIQFFLEGIHCPACLWLLEKLPEFKKGVLHSRLNMSSSILEVKANESAYVSEIAREIADLGYPPHPLASREKAKHQEALENRKDLSRIGVAAFCSMSIMLYAVSIYGGASDIYAKYFSWATFFLSLPVLFYSALPFYKSAWSSLKKGFTSIDQPIVLALLIGSFTGVMDLLSGRDETYFDSLTVLVFLLLLSRYILKKAQRKGLDSSLAGSFFGNGQAHRWSAEKGLFEDIYSKFLNPGDRIKVMPGEIYPADGLVSKGTTYSDVSLLSGESTPIETERNQMVYSGTVNLSNAVEVNVESVGKKTRLGLILEKIHGDRSGKSSLLSTVDSMTNKFILALFGLALVVLGANWHFIDGATAVTRTLSLIIVICPCALALATPLALTRGMNLAAKSGIIIKSFDVMERVSRATTLFFDKTGTLTYGTLSIDGWKDIKKKDIDSRSIVFSLEKYSNHPIANSLCSQLMEENIKVLPVTDFRENIGHGVSGMIEGRHFEIKKIDGFNGNYPYNTIGVFENNELITVISLKDSPRLDVEKYINEIKLLGKTSFILSGDKKENVTRIGSQVGISGHQQFFEFTPEEKHQLISNSENSIMIGDGANDAMALQKAGVGIAVRGSVEVSLRAADVYMTTPGIKPVYELIDLSAQTMKVIKRNLYFSLVYNLLGAGTAAIGFITPLSAAIIMPISSLTLLFSTIYGTKWAIRQ